MGKTWVRQTGQFGWSSWVPRNRSWCNFADQTGLIFQGGDRLKVQDSPVRQ